MSHKRQRHSGMSGAGESASANIYDGDSTAKPPHQQHGPVSVGLGYRVTFTLEPAVDGVAPLRAEWSPAQPRGRDARRIHDRYRVERDKFLQQYAVCADGSVIRVEVSE